MDLENDLLLKKMYWNPLLSTFDFNLTLENSYQVLEIVLQYKKPTVKKQTFSFDDKFVIWNWQ